MQRVHLPLVVTDARQRRRAVILAAAFIATTPLVATAAPRHDDTPARISAAAAGVVYGGVTADGFGLMVETNSSRGRIVRMATGLDMNCTSGDRFYTPDGWRSLTVKKRRFSATFGPETQRLDDGGTVDFEGTVTGRLNRSKTSISGTWWLKGTERDATGAVTDTCDSGTIEWTAKQ
jgi:hypothetical protein